MTADVLAQAPPSGPAGPGSGRRVALIVGGVVVVALLVAAAVWGVSRLGGGGTPAETTVDRSTDPDGLAALVLLLEAFEADVRRGGVDALAPGAPQPVDVVLVVPGVVLEPSERRLLDEWVGDGGREVTVTDGFGDPITRRPAFAPVELADPGCGMDTLDDVDRITVGPTEQLLPSGTGHLTCFPGPDAGELASTGFVGAVPAGRGAVVELGGISPFTNALLDRTDNAVLATSLLAPEPGTRVLLLEGFDGLPRSGTGTESGAGGVGGGTGGREPDQDLPGSGDEDDAEGSAPEDEPGLIDHVPEGIRWGLVQLLVALVAYIAWRGRRVGAPVEEPDPVTVDGSQLVAAVGTLLARTRSPERAGELLRAETCRMLAGRLGLPSGTDPLALSAAAATRLGLDEARARNVLAGPAPHDAEALVALAVQLDDLREEIRDGVPA